MPKTTLIKILSGVFGAFVVLIFAVAVNTLRYRAPSQLELGRVKKFEIDAGAASHRLAGALRFATVSGGARSASNAATFLGFQKFLKTQFPMTHGVLKRDRVSQLSLLYSWQGSDQSLKPILLSAHIDVVPVELGTEEKWTHPPFAGAIEEGFIWGRGAMDMKSSLLGLMEAVEYLLAHNFEPKRTIYLAFGHDEEIGGLRGASSIAELLADRGERLSFVLDEGMAIAHKIVPGVNRPVALVGLANKGFLNIELVARSAGGHSASPSRSTAIGRLARALQRLEANQMPVRITRPVGDMFDALAPYMPFADRLIVTNRWLFRPILLWKMAQKPATNASIRTTTAATMMKGGVKPNVLPQEARAVVNFRILPGDSISAVKRHVRRVINDPGIELRSYGHSGFEASQISDPSSHSFAALQDTIREIFPESVVAPSLALVPSDSRHYERITDNIFRFVPMRLRAGDLERFHGTNERISVSNYVEIIKFYIELLRNAAS